jgi:hypothetical protein
MLEAEEIGPQDTLSPLQCRGRQTIAAGWQLHPFPAHQLRGELPQSFFVLDYRPALIGCRRRTGEAHADPPMVAGRHQEEGKKPARKWLGRVSEALVDTATTLFGQENATAVAPVRQMIAPRPPRPALAKERQVADFRICFPSLRFEASPFLIGDGDQILFAATTADVAIPILENRQVTDR